MEVQHSKNFQELVVVANALRKEVATRQVALIKDRVLPKIAEESSKSKAPYRRLYETAHNLYSSMSDGIKAGDVGKGEYAEFVRELEQLVATTTAHENKPVKAARENPGQDSEAWLMQQTENAKRVMSKYRKYEPLVPRSLPKKFYAGRLPIMALTNPVLNREELQRQRLSEDMFFGYPIINRQLILGLNSDWVISDYKRDVQQAVQDVLEIINDQTGKKYFVLGEPKLRGSVQWCWLVTDNELRKLNKATVSGHFQLKSWSFPFEPDDGVRKPRV